MKWISDPTRRFARRPLYDRDEMEYVCQDLVERYFRDRNLQVAYPLSTETLELIVESLTCDYDSACDLLFLGEDVEGATEFSLRARPKVFVSDQLLAPNMNKRRRMTIAHELGHVHLHDVLYKFESTLELFSETKEGVPAICKRESIQRSGDWMEWQAGYAGGAILMPRHHTKRRVEALAQAGMTKIPSITNSPESRVMIADVASYFEISEEASRIRLLQLGYLEANEATRTLQL